MADMVIDGMPAAVSSMVSWPLQIPATRAQGGQWRSARSVVQRRHRWQVPKLKRLLVVERHLNLGPALQVDQYAGRVTVDPAHQERLPAHQSVGGRGGDVPSDGERGEVDHGHRWYIVDRIRSTIYGDAIRARVGEPCRDPFRPKADGLSATSW
jgi:hypothetical protein